MDCLLWMLCCIFYWFGYNLSSVLLDIGSDEEHAFGKDNLWTVYEDKWINFDERWQWTIEQELVKSDSID